MTTWTLQAFDASGNVIGSIVKTSEGPFTMHGTPDAFACCLPELRNIPGFCPTPESIAREAYEAYEQRLSLPERPAGTWAQLTADPANAPIIQTWLAVARAAMRTPAPTSN